MLLTCVEYGAGQLATLFEHVLGLGRLCSNLRKLNIKSALATLFI